MFRTNVQVGYQSPDGVAVVGVGFHRSVRGRVPGHGEQTVEQADGGDVAQHDQSCAGLGRHGTDPAAGSHHVHGVTGPQRRCPSAARPAGPGGEDDLEMARRTVEDRRRVMAKAAP
ncbi:hypothetical protein O7632_17445 [Solwaraspora sp. WMMD406]|uniref:hypothetical protein n=1 Tax=Solwaraspora sp. WMMD406 TaxID=3016095 RepID=UPI002417CF3B|nr:hypothetical protein [Solwaraspora sp. WMMD406]MDG4765872.1 hypothetical protein [Solwaraspora sp. WMMD406]